MSAGREEESVAESKKWELLEKANVFPLKIITMRDGEVESTQEVTGIEARALSASASTPRRVTKSTRWTMRSGRCSNRFRSENPKTNPKKMTRTSESSRKGGPHGHKTLYVVAIFLLSTSPLAFGQGETAVPFLLITSSVEGNGMGGISASTNTHNAMAPLANPGQLGLLTLTHHLAATTYTPKAKWLPKFGRNDLSYNASAVNVGINLGRALGIPLPISYGFGYSRVFLNLGTFARTGPDGPDPISFFEAHEKVNAFSTAIGFDYGVKVGVGVTLKRIVSQLSPFGTEQEEGLGTAKVNASDVGALVQIPVMELADLISPEPTRLFPTISPFLNLTASYTRSNQGGSVVYTGRAQADPLPRQALLGISWEGGIRSTALSRDWTLASFTWAREAQDVLVTRFADGTFTYQRGTGDIRFFQNVILGKWGGKVTVRKGWQLNLAEIVYIRGGSVVMPGLQYSTEGFGVSLGGIFKWIESFSPTGFENEVLVFLVNHLDVQYDESSYSNTESPIQGTVFRGINFVLK